MNRFRREFLKVKSTSFGDILNVGGKIEGNY